MPLELNIIVCFLFFYMGFVLGKKWEGRKKDNRSGGTKAEKDYNQAKIKKLWNDSTK